MNISPVPDGPVLPLNLRIADDAQETDRRRINHHGSMLDGSVKEKTVAGAQVINLVVMPIIHFSFQHEKQFVTWMAKYVLARIDLSLLDVHEVRLKIFLKRQAKGQGLIVVPHLRAPADDDLSFVFADEYRPTLRTIDLEEVAWAHSQRGSNSGQGRNGRRNQPILDLGKLAFGQANSVGQLIERYHTLESERANALPDKLLNGWRFLWGWFRFSHQQKFPQKKLHWQPNFNRAGSYALQSEHVLIWPTQGSAKPPPCH